MKVCPHCHAEVEENFDLCWKCNYSFSEQEVVQIKDEAISEREIQCMRCAIPMIFEGNYSIHEGIWFDWWKNFDLYVCPQCGKVEFFLPKKELEKRKRKF